MALSYPTDLSDEQWELLVPLLPCAKPGGRPYSVDVRAIVNAIVYIVVAGCAWRMRPKDLPKWKTVYHYVRAFRNLHLRSNDSFDAEAASVISTFSDILLGTSLMFP